MENRSGPAAVTLPFADGSVNGTLAAPCATVVMYRNGKAAARAGEPEDLPRSDFTGGDGKAPGR